MIPAAEAVNQICRELNYSRSHVANLLRRNARFLGAKKVDRRWRMPKSGIALLRTIVRLQSGPRYKYGEHKK